MAGSKETLSRYSREPGGPATRSPWIAPRSRSARRPEDR